MNIGGMFDMINSGVKSAGECEAPAAKRNTILKSEQKNKIKNELLDLYLEGAPSAKEVLYFLSLVDKMVESPAENNIMKIRDSLPYKYIQMLNYLPFVDIAQWLREYGVASEEEKEKLIEVLKDYYKEKNEKIIFDFNKINKDNCYMLKGEDVYKIDLFSAEESTVGLFSDTLEVKLEGYKVHYSTELQNWVATYK